MTEKYLEQAKLTVENKMEIKPYTRFALWEGHKHMGEHIIRCSEMPSETTYFIEKLVPHSENGIDLDYETTEPIYEGFVKDNIEQILLTVENGEGGYVKGNSINVFSPSFPLQKDRNVKYKECNEKWLNEGEFHNILEQIGEANYESLKEEIEKGKTITFRYINENNYKESIFKCGTKTRYIQLFVDGKNFGYTEDHPHREYKKTEDGRTIAIGEPTIYYDFLIYGYEFDIHRIGSLNLWIKS